MTRVTVVMDLNFDGFKEANDEDKFGAIETILQDGAEANNAEINIHEIQISNK